jgi:hypothetical protein
MFISGLEHSYNKVAVSLVQNKPGSHVLVKSNVHEIGKEINRESYSEIDYKEFICQSSYIWKLVSINQSGCILYW